jgi:hypothetical protein
MVHNKRISSTLYGIEQVSSLFVGSGLAMDILYFCVIIGTCLPSNRLFTRISAGSCLWSRCLTMGIYVTICFRNINSCSVSFSYFIIVSLKQNCGA